MKFQLRKCDICLRYTLKNECISCQNSTKLAHPSKFSPDDKYMKYRIPEKYQRSME